jgi:hypothetical protein
MSEQINANDLQAHGEAAAQEIEQMVASFLKRRGHDDVVKSALTSAFLQVAAMGALGVRYERFQMDLYQSLLTCCNDFIESAERRN